MDVFRTPDERFAGLPGFPWTPRYVEWEGLRLAYVDEGPRDAATVVLFHGEPTWSFLWRKVVPPLLDAGLRCVLPDLPGFGRSDKPTDMAWYSFDRHVAAAGAVLDAAGVRDACFVVHDWGGPIGLRLAVERPEACARFVVMDTGLFSGEQRMSDAWQRFRDFVERTEDLPVGFLVRGACHRPVPDEVIAAYEAPFPTPQSKARVPAMPGADAGRATGRALREDDRPALVLWADRDPVIPVETGRRFAASLGLPEPEVVADASHFLQEDAGDEIGRRIAAWLQAGGAAA